MRLLISFLSLGVAAGSAFACPRTIPCVSAQVVSTARDAAKPPAEVPAAALEAPPTESKHHWLVPTTEGDRVDVELPWYWQALRERVYDRLPRYERAQTFTLVLSPVVVTSPSDTVPGVGVGGAF